MPYAYPASHCLRLAGCGDLTMTMPSYPKSQTLANCALDVGPFVALQLTAPLESEFDFGPVSSLKRDWYGIRVDTERDVKRGETE